MKILYGIQGTGNGHTTRGRVMARQLARHNIDVQYLFSGRNPENFFDMGIFGDALYRSGLSFSTVDGKISYWQTLRNDKLLQLFKEVKTLDVSTYDLVLTDFEPVVAWAAKLANKPVIALGHQYAFDHDIPLQSDNIISRLIMSRFTPAQTRIGLHWHHFDANIFPPIIEQQPRINHREKKQILVYLPFENQSAVTELLNDYCPGYRFVQYSPDVSDSKVGNCLLRKSCLRGFKKDLDNSAGVICNAGFELISECLALGLPVLAKPVKGQMEQLSNARSLQLLGGCDLNLMWRFSP